MNSTNIDEAEADRDKGDLLIGAKAIESFLEYLGWADADAYHLKRSGILSIGNTAGNGGLLVASKKKIRRDVQRLASPPASA